jgi:DNA invertase Pin-like site-specific DNA recombinase
MKPAAQYLRMSTDLQLYSLDNQVSLIAEYASREGYEVTHSYEDAGKSGVTTKHRIGLKTLLRDVLAGAPFSTILVVDVSRWGRYQDPDEAAHYEFLCREAGVRVVYCAEPFDDDRSPTASIVKNLKRVMAAEYSRQLADRCRLGIRRRRLAGGKGGGRAPYGFRRQVENLDGTMGPLLADGERRFRPDQTVKIVKGPPEELRVVRRIFRLFADGLCGVTEIAHILNAASVPYRNGQKWNDTRVKAVLRNEIAIGFHVFNRQPWSFGQPLPKLPPEEWLRVQVLSPVVSRALFDRAQAKFASLNGNVFTDDEMLQKLRLLRSKHGYLSRRLIDADPDVQWSGAYVRRFGSMLRVYDLVGWEGVRRAGEHVDAAGMEPDEIVKRLKAVHTKVGYLNSKLIEATPTLPSVATIKKRLGTLDEAYRLAGYDLTHSQKLQGGWERRRARQLEKRRSAAAPAVTSS